jgi:cysteine desulfurase
MAAALTACLDDMADEAARRWGLTRRLREGLGSIPRVQLHGHPTQRVPHLACFSVDAVDAEILAMALDERGFRLSVGSNCSGAPGEPSPILEQMGIPNTASFRLGVGRETGSEDVEALIEVLPGLIQELRAVEEAAEAAMARFRPSPEDPSAPV